MSEPATRHIWMPDGRSICDRHDHPWQPEPEQDPAADAQRLHEPACGACLLVANMIRQQAVEALEFAQEAVWPASPHAAWALLADTRWNDRWDLAATAERERVESRSRFDAVRLAAREYRGRRLRASAEEIAAK